MIFTPAGFIGFYTVTDIVPHYCGSLLEGTLYSGPVYSGPASATSDETRGGFTPQPIELKLEIIQVSHVDRTNRLDIGSVGAAGPPPNEDARGTGEQSSQEL